MTENIPDEIIMQKIKNGNLAEMSILFERYHLRLFNFFLKMGLNRDTSQDLTQNLFYRMIKYRDSYRNEYSVKSWIYQIARNLHTDYCNQQKKSDALFTQTETYPVEVTEENGNYREDEYCRLEKALSELSDSQREIIVLSRYQGLKYGEISAITNQSVPAIKVAMHRAIRQLRTIYMKCEEVESLIIDYLENKLEQGKIVEIEKHLGICEKCLDELKDTQQLLRLMSDDKMVKPDDTLRINFHHMLQNEIRKAEAQNQEHVAIRRMHWFEMSGYRVAAGIALLLGGTFLGILLYSTIVNSKDAKEIVQLRSEVNELRKAALHTMLKDESSTYRIQAVNYADQIAAPDNDIIEALIKTLNNDKNVNVRMSAAYALSKFTGQKAVRDSLVKSLSIQTDPILQVTLINILADLKEKSALDAIRRILSDENTLDEVKTVAQKGAKMLI